MCQCGCAVTMGRFLRPRAAPTRPLYCSLCQLFHKMCFPRTSSRSLSLAKQCGRRSVGVRLRTMSPCAHAHRELPRELPRSQPVSNEQGCGGGCGCGCGSSSSATQHNFMPSPPHPQRFITTHTGQSASHTHATASSSAVPGSSQMGVII